MSYTSTLTYVDADFRTAFPYFANTTQYTQAQLAGYFAQGSAWISTFNFGSLNNAGRQLALYQMTAHLQTIADQTAENANAPGGVEIEGSIDKIRVAIMPPKVTNAWQQWLSQTTYGQALLALLLKQAVGGFWIGGNPELAAFRRVGGGFSRGFW